MRQSSVISSSRSKPLGYISQLEDDYQNREEVEGQHHEVDHQAAMPADALLSRNYLAVEVKARTDIEDH
jgi:hypothetical protein